VLGEVGIRDNPWGSSKRTREWQPVMGQQKLRWEVAA